jgi:hypothetical protein
MRVYKIKSNCIAGSFLLIVLFSLLPVPAQSDTTYLAIDLVYLSYEKGFTGDIPAIVFRDNESESYHFWAMTLNPETGSQKGTKLKLRPPPDDNIPVDVLWVQHFNQFDKGTVPSPFIVFENHHLYTFPLTFEEDGTPVAGGWSLIDPLTSPDPYGNATCAAELPGTEFQDGWPRLFIGTELGNIIVLVSEWEGIYLDDIFTVTLTSQPILDIEPIPQFGYISLGILTNNLIYGVDPEMSRIDKEEKLAVTIYSLADPRPSPLGDFDIFGGKFSYPPDDVTPIPLILANGSNELGLTSILSSMSGSYTLEVTTDNKDYKINMAGTGSLLTLSDDGPPPRYDPAYSEETGSSGCEVDVIDDINGSCDYICGDANGDDISDILDIVHLIDWKFKDGPHPDPLVASNVNGDKVVDILDMVHLIDWKFKECPPGSGPGTCPPPDCSL